MAQSDDILAQIKDLPTEQLADAMGVINYLNSAFQLWPEATVLAVAYAGSKWQEEAR